eukprot:27443-Eustigmatos_ZCMA.PRE.1
MAACTDCRPTLRRARSQSSHMCLRPFVPSASLLRSARRSSHRSSSRASLLIPSARMLEATESAASASKRPASRAKSNTSD